MDPTADTAWCPLELLLSLKQYHSGYVNTIRNPCIKPAENTFIDGINKIDSMRRRGFIRDKMENESRRWIRISQPVCKNACSVSFRLNGKLR